MPQKYNPLTGQFDLVNPPVTGVATGKNLLINGNFLLSQRGTTFDSTTTPANNNDTYLLDRWILLSNGNNTVDVSHLTNATIGHFYSLRADVETVQKKFEFLKIIEQVNIACIDNIICCQIVSGDCRIYICGVYNQR